MDFIRRTIVEIFDSYPPPPKFCSREEDRDVGQLAEIFIIRIRKRSDWGERVACNSKANGKFDLWRSVLAGGRFAADRRIDYRLRGRALLAEPELLRESF